MSNKFLVSFAITENQVLKAEQGNFQCVKEDEKTKLLACGTSDGILRIVKFSRGNIEVFNKAIDCNPIESVCWLSNGVVCMSFNSPQLALYDPFKDTATFHSPCTANIRYSLTISDFEILSWHRNGFTILTDLRTSKQIIIEDSEPVTVANVHPTLKNIIYTCTVPGTTLKVWDLRYTKRGKYVSEPFKVSNQYACDLEMFDGALFVVDNSSAFYKTSETGKFTSKITSLPSTVPRRNGNISINKEYNSLFVTLEGGIYTLFNDCMTLISSGESFIGCTGSKNNLFVYTKKRLTNYKINPFLQYKRK